MQNKTKLLDFGITHLTSDTTWIAFKSGWTADIRFADNHVACHSHTSHVVQRHRETQRIGCLTGTLCKPKVKHFDSKITLSFTVSHFAVAPLHAWLKGEPNAFVYTLMSSKWTHGAKKTMTYFTFFHILPKCDVSQPEKHAATISPMGGRDTVHAITDWRRVTLAHMVLRKKQLRILRRFIRK